MSTHRIRVAVADDHAVIRLGIAAELDEMPSVDVIGTATNSTELLAILREQECDVLITDYAMPGGTVGDGMQLLQHLQQHYPDLRIVVMTGLDQPSMIQALYAAGLTRILSKADDANHVQAAVQAALVNRRYLSPSIVPLLPARGAARPSNLDALSPREREVLLLFLQGHTINAIADQLGRRKQTISTQKISAMQKLGAENEADLYRIAAEFGLAEPRGAS